MSVPSKELNDFTWTEIVFVVAELTCQGVYEQLRREEVFCHNQQHETCKRNGEREAMRRE
jgi:hypothetical protein